MKLMFLWLRDLSSDLACRMVSFHLGVWQRCSVSWWYAYSCRGHRWLLPRSTKISFCFSSTDHFNLRLKVENTLSSSWHSHGELSQHKASRKKGRIIHVFLSLLSLEKSKRFTNQLECSCWGCLRVGLYQIFLPREGFGILVSWKTWRINI